MASTSYLLKLFNCFVIGFLFYTPLNSYSQNSIEAFKKDSLSTILPEVSPLKNKIIPSQFDTIVKIAFLYFPELEKVSIKIRVKNQASPLNARPNIFALFRKAAKRKYIITISNNTNSKFSSILLSNLSFNSQIGVIGHELSHISDYNQRNGLFCCKLMLMHLSKKTMDRFEYNTDMLCIKHGLGYQLLSWSKEVRVKLNLTQWKGIKRLNKQGRERYMNPGSIVSAMAKIKIYNKN